MKTWKLRIGRFVNFLVVDCDWRFRHTPIFPMQFDLLRGTVTRRKPSTGNRRLVLSHTPRVLLVLALKIREGLSLEIFADVDYASKTTNGRSMSVRAMVCGGTCVCWFSRTQNVSRSLRMKQSMLLLVTQ